MLMNKKVIPICLYVDHDCLLHAMVCFLSIKDHNPSAHICLVYKEDFPLSKEEIAWFEENKPVWGEVEFVCFPQNAEPLLDIAGKLEKYQQILWINSKSIVQTELTPLLSLNMGESIFAACAKNMSQKERNYATVCLNLQEGLYFNLNICIINVGSYMKADAGERCRNYMADHQDLWHPVEDTVNVVFGRFCTELDASWNVPVQSGISDQRLDWYPQDIREKTDTAVNPLIVNYGAIDSYHILNSQLGHVWLGYVLQIAASPFFPKLFHAFLGEAGSGAEDLLILLQIVQQKIEQNAQLAQQLQAETEKTRKLEQASVYKLYGRVKRLYRKVVKG